MAGADTTLALAAMDHQLAEVQLAIDQVRSQIARIRGVDTEGGGDDEPDVRTGGPAGDAR